MCGLIPYLCTWQHCTSVTLITYCRVHTMELWLLDDDNNSSVQPVELQWSDCSNDPANPGLIVNTVIVSDHTYWWHVLPRLDLASSQSDKLWWVFQSKHNWSSLLTSNLYSARVHLTRHCRPHLTVLTELSFTVPDHFTIWGNKHRARCYHQPYQAVSAATLLSSSDQVSQWRNGSYENWIFFAF